MQHYGPGSSGGQGSAAAVLGSSGPYQASEASPARSATSSGRRSVSDSKAPRALGCGGCVAVTVVAILAAVLGAVIWSLGTFADSVEADLRQNPVIIEHIGRIESFKLELHASLIEPGDDSFVFRVEGTRGAGLVHATCVTVDDGSEDVVAGTLQLDAGEMTDLFPGLHDREGLTQ